jgi:hypothetical protein
LNGFAYNPPKFHPFNPLAALRMSLKEVSGDNQHQVIDAIFEGGWCRGEDLGDLPTLVSLLEERAIDGNYLSQQIAEPNVKQLLVDETNMAIDLGVFGVPCMIVDDLLFWGNDQMEHIELVLGLCDPERCSERCRIAALLGSGVISRAFALPSRAHGRRRQRWFGSVQTVLPFPRHRRTLAWTVPWIPD